MRILGKKEFLVKQNDNLQDLTAKNQKELAKELRSLEKSFAMGGYGAAEFLRETPDGILYQVSACEL
jgi:hypothetical protein